MHNVRLILKRANTYRVKSCRSKRNQSLDKSHHFSHNRIQESERARIVTQCVHFILRNNQPSSTPIFTKEPPPCVFFFSCTPSSSPQFVSNLIHSRQLIHQSTCQRYLLTQKLTTSVVRGTLFIFVFTFYDVCERILAANCC